MDKKTVNDEPEHADPSVVGTPDPRLSSRSGPPNARSPAALQDREIVHIRPRGGLSWDYLHDLWNARSLIKVLVWRDLRVRYKQTVFGVAWVFLQPIMTALLYSLLFGWIARMPSEGVPYPIFLLTALLPWLFVSRLVSEGATSVASNSALVSKIYFPRLVLPLTVAGSLLVDLLVGFGVALVAMAIFGYFPGIRILALPLIIVFAAASGLSVALILAPLDVNYRDVRMLIPFTLQMVMFVSPILYSVTVVPEKLRLIFDLNPIAVIANTVRWSLLAHGDLPDAGTIMISVGLVASLLALGVWLFVRAETRFSDRI
jgi:lipopolysaccharide transport system permease protein